MSESRYIVIDPNEGPVGPRGPGTQINASGATAGRAAHDAEPTGFTYADTSVSPVALSIKQTDAPGDWSPWFPFQGPKGDDPFQTWKRETNRPDATFAEYLAAIKGDPGESVKGDPGVEGPSAYELAVSLGYGGTLAEWLGTLKGEPGRGWLYGEGPPADALGNDGDFYIDTQGAKTNHGPKAGGAWPAGTSMRGAPGLDSFEDWKNRTNQPNATYDQYQAAFKGDPGESVKGDPGESFKPDATGTLAGRAEWDLQPPPFGYLATDQDPHLLYWKGIGDGVWSVGRPLGVPGPPGLDSFEEWKVITNQPNAAYEEYQQAFRGAAGPGLPTGGATGQFLRKKSAANYHHEHVDLTASLANATPPAGFVGTNAQALLNEYAASIAALDRRNGLSQVPFGRLAIGAVSSELSVDFPAAKAIDGDNQINGMATGGPAKGWLTSSKVVSALTGDWINVIVGPMTLVTIGDSLTLGRPGHTPGDPLDDPFSCFQVHLQEMQGRVVVNKGVGGQTSAQILARMGADVHFFKPSHCAILAGTNDISTGVAAATTQANLASMWNSCVTNGTVPILSTLPPYNGGTTAMKQAILDLNAYIRNQAAANGWPLADYYPVLEDPASPGNMRTSEVAADGLLVHPTAAGYARMSTAWEKTLRQIARAPRLVGIGLSGQMGASRPANYVRPTQYVIKTRAPGPTSGFAREESFAANVGAVEGIDYVSMPSEAAWRYGWFRVGFGAMSGDTALAGKHTGLGEVLVYTQS